jgi:hypothetical protein
MASGFQLDNSQITPGLYRVTIDMSNTSNYPVSNGSAVTATQGGVNPYDWTQGTWYTGGNPTSDAYAKALAQGNLRWDQILELLASYTDARVLNISVTTGGTTGNSQPTALSFTVAFDRDQFLLTEYSKVQAAAGATTSGFYVVTPNTAQVGASVTYTTYANISLLQAAGYSGIDNVRVFQAYQGKDASTAITTPALAVKDIVTTAITSGGTTGWSRTYRVYSVAQTGDSQVLVSLQQPSTPSTVFGTVTVSQVALTGIAY